MWKKLCAKCILEKKNEKRQVCSRFRSNFCVWSSKVQNYIRKMGNECWIRDREGCCIERSSMWISSSFDIHFFSLTFSPIFLFTKVHVGKKLLTLTFTWAHVKENAPSNSSPCNATNALSMRMPHILFRGCFRALSLTNSLTLILTHTNTLPNAWNAISIRINFLNIVCNRKCGSARRQHTQFLPLDAYYIYIWLVAIAFAINIKMKITHIDLLL